MCILRQFTKYFQLHAESTRKGNIWLNIENFKNMHWILKVDVHEYASAYIISNKQIVNSI